MKRLSILVLVVLLAPLFMLGASGQGEKAGAAAPVFLNIATGGTAGTYYPLGGAMAEIINANVPGVNATAVSTGASVANVNMLATDEVQMGLIQNDVTYYAVKGMEAFQGKPQPDLRGIASLYNETIQIITVANTGIRSLDQLRGKRVAVGAAGSGTDANARQILGAAGITYNDISVQYLSFAEAANGLRDGNVDAAFLTAGYPTAAVRDVASQRDVVVLPIPDDLARKIMAEYPFYARDIMPANTYPKQDAPVPTLAVKAMLVVRADLPEEIAYGVTRAIFENLDRLAQSHAIGAAIKKETATEGMPIELHPGAERYLSE